jgi:hypothetical protein
MRSFLVALTLLVLGGCCGRRQCNPCRPRSAPCPAPVCASASHLARAFEAGFQASRGVEASARIDAWVAGIRRFDSNLTVRPWTIDPAWCPGNPLPAATFLDIWVLVSTAHGNGQLGDLARREIESEIAFYAIHPDSDGALNDASVSLPRGGAPIVLACGAAADRVCQCLTQMRAMATAGQWGWLADRLTHGH